MASIAEAWASFEAMVVPAGAGATQRREMKRAFYGGVSAMLMFALSLGDKSDAEEDAAIAELDAMSAEVIAFAEAVEAGRA